MSGTRRAVLWCLCVDGSARSTAKFVKVGGGLTCAEMAGEVIDARVALVADIAREGSADAAGTRCAAIQARW